MKWTPSQKQAIEAPIGNILINAGAGSGKTAVLTERIIRRLKHGVSINRLLVVTFTKKAALEMKERLRLKLEEESVEFPELRQQLNLLDSAMITTIDGFANNIVSQFGYLLDLPADTSIIDRVMLLQQKSRMLESMMEQWYLDERPDFIEYVSTFSIKNDNEIFSEIMALDEIFRAYNNQLEIFTEHKERFHSEEFKAQLEVDYVKAITDQLQLIKQELLLFDLIPSTESYDPYIEAYKDQLSVFFEPASNYDTYHQRVDTYRADRRPRLAKPIWVKELNPEMDSYISKMLLEDEEITQLEYLEYQTYVLIDNTRQKIKKSIEKLFELVEKPWSEIIDDYDAIAYYQEILISLTVEYHQKVNEYYQESGLMDFASMANTALELVTRFPQVQQELQERFVELFVDEYQDTSPIQDKLITLISYNNLFCVGDVKQSIYGFRQADPQLFLAKQELFEKDPRGLVIHMNDNFRSRSTLLDGINTLFGLIMSPDLGGVLYDDQQALKPGKDYPVFAQQPSGLHFIKHQKYKENAEDNEFLLDYDDPDYEDQLIDVYFSNAQKSSNDLDETMSIVPYTAHDRIDEDDYEVFDYSGDDGDLADDFLPVPSYDEAFEIGEESDILLVIQDIKQKMDSGFMIQGEDGPRPVKYDDFVVLVDRRSAFRQFQLIFDYHELPVYIHMSESFITTTDVQALKNLFRLIYSFHNDEYFIKTFKHLYASIARSYIWTIPDDEIHRFLMALRSNPTSSIDDVLQLAPDLSKQLLQTARELGKMLNNLTVYDFVQEVFHRFNIFEQALTLYDYDRVEKRLFFMLEKAAEFMRTGLQIHDFIDYFDFLNRQDQADLDIDFLETTQLQPNRVNIMTIHASKGLEFPIVYYPNLLANFRMFFHDVVEFSFETGLISHGFKGGTYLPITTAIYYNSQKQRLLSERLRLLYVALTRAKELAVVILSIEDQNDKIKSLPSSTITPQYVHTMAGFFNLFNLEEVFGPVNPVTLIDKYLDDYRVPKPQQPLTLSKDQMDMHRLALDLPSVAPLRPRTGSTQILELLSLDQLSAVEYGNYLHELLSFIDLKEPLDPQIERMNIAIKDALYIRRFVESELMSNIQNATIYHEYRFHDISDEGPINGIIDLVLQFDDHCKIIDFKLKDIHKSHYQEQVALYVKYLSKIMDIPVRGYLYSMITSEIEEVQ